MDKVKNRYHAFISYRHLDNTESGRQWATWLHQSIETYQVPEELVGKINSRGEEIPERIFPVFRDEEALPADADLSNAITRALDNTQFLVILCSPRARASTFVADEIRYFKQLGRSDRIIAAMIDGEPNASVDDGKLTSGFSTEDECFPEPLQYVFDEQGNQTAERAEPIAADFRVTVNNKKIQGWTTPSGLKQYLESLDDVPKDDIQQQVKNYDKQLQLMLLKVVAGILGVPLDELTQRDKQYQLELERQRAQKLRRWLAIVMGLAVLAIGAGTMAYFKQQEAVEQREIARQNQQEAEAQREIAEQQTQVAELEKERAQKELYKVSMLAARDLLARGEIGDVRSVIYETAELHRNIEWEWFNLLSNTRPWTVDVGMNRRSFVGTTSIFASSEGRLTEVNKQSGEVIKHHSVDLDIAWKVNQDETWVLGQQETYSDGNLLIIQNYQTGEILHQWSVPGLFLRVPFREFENKVYLEIDYTQVMTIDLLTFEQAYIDPIGMPENARFTDIFIDKQHKKVILTGFSDTYILDEDWRFERQFDGSLAESAFPNRNSPFSPDGQMLALVFLNRVTVVDIQTGEELYSKYLHNFMARDRYGPRSETNFLYFLDNDTLISGGNDNTVKITDWKQQQSAVLGDANEYDWYDNPIYQIHQLSEFEILVHGASGLHLHSGQGFANQRTILIDDARITSLSVAGGGQEVYLGAENGKFQRWNRSSLLGNQYERQLSDLVYATSLQDFTQNEVLDDTGESSAKGEWQSLLFESKRIHWFSNSAGRILTAYVNEPNASGEQEDLTNNVNNEIELPWINEQGMCITRGQYETREVFALVDCNQVARYDNEWLSLSNNDAITAAHFLTENTLLMQTEGEFLIEYDSATREIVRQWHIPTSSEGTEQLTIVDVDIGQEFVSYISSSQWQQTFYDDGTVLLAKDDQLFTFDLNSFKATEVVTPASATERSCINTDSRSSASINQNEVVISVPDENVTRTLKFPESVDNCVWLDEQHIVFDSLRVTIIYDVISGEFVSVLLNTAVEEDDIYDASTERYLSTLPLFSVDDSNLIVEYGYERGSFDYYDEYDQYNPWKKTSYRRGVRLFNLDSAEAFPWLDGYKPNGNYVHAVNVNSEQIYVSDDGKRGGIWSFSGSKLKDINILSGELLVARFSSLGDRLALGSTDRLIRLFDTTTGEMTFELAGHSDSVTVLYWLSKDTRLLSYGNDNLLNLWDTESGRLMFTYSLTDQPQSIALSEDNNFVVITYESERQRIPLKSLH